MGEVRTLSRVADVPSSPAPGDIPPVVAPVEGRAVLAVRVRSSAGKDDPGRARWITVGVAAVGVLAVGVVLWVGKDWPLLGGLAWGLAVVAALDFVLVRPVQLFLRRMASEAARLRAALACPYCRAGLEDDRALGCDRPGCGALYHEACWDECRGSYGGCAIYGCGSKTAHGIGWFALQRRVWRVVVAAVLFTPRVVQRLQAAERATLREEWRRAREVQRGISASIADVLVVGLVNAFVCVGGSLLLIYLSQLKVVRIAVVIWGSLALMGVSIAFMRAPLVGVFLWGVLRVVARLFRDELALLQRADAGTFLARLAGGAGKKA